MTFLDNKRIGNGLNRRAKTVHLKYALLHLRKQFVTGEAKYIKPFMVALASEALIRYYEEVEKDERIIPALRIAADRLYQDFWDASAGAMRYVDRPQEGDDPANPAPDLNLLIVPLYSFLAKETGSQVYAKIADELFAKGVALAYVARGKQFNQNYRWSFRYVNDFKSRTRRQKTACRNKRTFARADILDSSKTVRLNHSALVCRNGGKKSPALSTRQRVYFSDETEVS
jgi:hypothetical protein